MATLGQLRSRIKGLLDRDDCTDDMATGFLVDGIGLIQTKLRIPSMERVALYTNATAAMSSIPIPPDFIAPLDLFVPASPGFCGGNVSPDGELALAKKSYRQLQAIPRSYPPIAYARLQAAFEVRGSVPVGSYIKLVYHGEFTAFTSDTDENEISASSPSLCAYAALVFAGDYFDSPKLSSWEARFQSLMEAIQQQGDDVDNGGGPEVVSPTYEA